MSQAGIINLNGGGGGGGPVRTLTGDTGGAVGPTAGGNINVKALYTNSVVGSPGTNTLTVTPTSRGYPITPYVVGPVGFGGYQTIQSALTAIGVGGSGQVWIYPGTYTEDLIFPSGINVGLITGSDESAGSVILVGTHDPSLAANIVTWRIGLTAGASGHIFSSNAAGTGQIVCVHNNFICNGYIFNLPNFTAAAGLNIVLMADRLSTASGVINNTGGAFFGSFENTLGVGSTFPAIISGPAVIEVNNWSCPIQTQGSSNINFYDSNFFAPMTLGGATNGFITNNYHTTGSSACITYNSTANTLLSTCVLDSSNNPAIAGNSAGTLTMGGLTFVTNKNISALVTKAGAAGFFASNLTAHGVVLGEGNACLGVTAAGLTGQVLAGNTGADPSFQTLPTAMTWTDVTSATQTLAVNNGYITDRGAGVTYTLPATASLGNVLKVDGKLGLTTIAQNATQAIRMGSSLSTTGVGGSVVGTNVGDCITLRCTTSGASTIWIAENWVGSWTVT